MEKIKTNVLYLATLGALIAGVCGWKIIGIFEGWVAQSIEEGAVVAVSGLEAVFVALLTAIVAAYVGGILVLAGQVAAGSPPPQYPAQQVNDVVNKVLEFFGNRPPSVDMPESPAPRS